MSISVKTQRKRFKAASVLLKNGEGFTEEDKSFFMRCFEKIGDGADAKGSTPILRTLQRSLMIGKRSVYVEEKKV